MIADTDEKINECIEKSLNYLSAIGRPMHRLEVSFPTGFGKKHDICYVCFGEGFVAVALLAMTEKYKTIITAKLCEAFPFQVSNPF